MKQLYEYIRRFIDRINEDRLGLYAAQASFFIVFSVTPFIMLLITLAKYILPVELDTVLTEIYNYIPQSLAMVLTNIVMDAFESSPALISVSAVSVLWLASKGIGALFLGLNNIFKPDKSFGYIYTKVISVLYTLLFIVVLVLTVATLGFGQFVFEKISHIPVISPLVGLINGLLAFRHVWIMLILTLTFASFYKFLPRNKSFVKQLPGALFAAAGWTAFSHIYSIYIESFSQYSYVYGSLAAIIFLMLWLYICMNILLYGAEINKLREEKFFKQGLV